MVKVELSLFFHRRVYAALSSSAETREAIVARMQARACSSSYRATKTNIIFFSRNKSTKSTFQLIFSAKRIGPPGVPPPPLARPRTAPPPLAILWPILSPAFRLTRAPALRRPIAIYSLFRAHTTPVFLPSLCWSFFREHPCLARRQWPRRLARRRGSYSRLEQRCMSSSPQLDGALGSHARALADSGMGACGTLASRRWGRMRRALAAHGLLPARLLRSALYTWPFLLCPAPRARLPSCSAPTQDHARPFLCVQSAAALRCRVGPCEPL
jgi:hypothetical protein